jgi:peroxiredoxin
MKSIVALALFASLTAAPDFTLKSLDGRNVRLSSLHGKVVIVNFWATWCAACKVEIPELVESYRRHHEEGLEIVGVSMDDANNDAVARFAKSKNVSYTIVRGDAAVASAYGGVQFLPQSFVIDRRGKIVKTFSGPPDKKELDALLRSLLHERLSS